MADIDVKCSHDSGATLPPSPSPSTVGLGTAEGPPFRIKHLQPQPVTVHVYQAITEVNRGFKRLTQGLQNLQQFSFFPPDNLIAWLNMVLRLQAETNSLLLESINSREISNAAYYDRLCHEWERELADPDDVLIEAEHRKQELAEEQKRKETENANS